MEKRNKILVGMAFLVMVIAAACQGEPQVVVVEVTRKVTETETIVVEGEAVEVEVTRVVEVVPDEPQPVEATGSEEGEPSPFVPGSGQKLVVTRVSGDGWVDQSAASAETVDLANNTRAESNNPAVLPTAVVLNNLNNEVASENILTAAEVDDNAAWEAYLAYQTAYEGQDIIALDVTERHEIIVLDGEGWPVLAAELSFALPNGEVVYRLRTHSDGRAYFFPRLLPAAHQADSYTVTVTADHTQLIDSFNLLRDEATSQQWMLNTDYAAVEPLATKLDLFFIIDATGSMGDEIQQLKENITVIAARLDALDVDSLVRYGMTIYRDRGDEFTSQTYQFTADVHEFAAALTTIEAAGGGDYPEDLQEALGKSLQIADWRTYNTVSLAFIIGDAPPHLDYADQIWSYDVAALQAAAQGIKIFPIASSGLDEQGEYIYRQLAQITGGKFLFLTYGAAGVGSTGNNTDFSITNYDVSSLDGLISKIIAEELAQRQRPFNN